MRTGEGTLIGAGSVVLIDVPPRTTKVILSSRLLGEKEEEPSSHKRCARGVNESYVTLSSQNGQII